MAKALMFQGTGSDVGKTVLVAGLCRAARNRGIRVAPFKPQNMSNNAAVASADNGQGEIGRGQWLQALACGMEPSVHMNPVLLKPQSQTGSQVIVQGKVHTTAKAHEYLALKPHLMKSVLESFEKVREDADLVLVEGAGSPAEVNLRKGDIANMGFSTEADVPVVLIGDIDRGGVIASLVGTHATLDTADRNQVVGYLINKFRGDISLFDDGLRIISEKTGWRGFGVLPWVDAVRQLPAEDSVILDRLGGARPGGFHVVVPAPGKVANFDDLDPLVSEPGVSVQFLRNGEAFPETVDLVILPGSKSTIADLAELRANGWDRAILQHARSGGHVIGICGGYQMLGKAISDPLGLEGKAASVKGLGLLDVETELKPEKIVRTASPVSVEFGCALEGYEIHMGISHGPDCARPMVKHADGKDGAISAGGNVRGCYLHGLFDSDAYRAALLASFGHEAGPTGHRARIQQALDELAEEMETRLDIDGLLEAAR